MKSKVVRNLKIKAIISMILCFFSSISVNAETLGDINGDNLIDLKEVIYSLQVVAGIRPQETLPFYDFSKARSLIRQNNVIRFENVIIENEHYWVHYKGGNFITPLSKGKLNTIQIPYLSVDIDGYLDDWNTIAPIYSDPENDQNLPGGHLATDIKEVYLARDNENLYMALTLYDGLPLNNIQYNIELLLYHDQLHTPGDTVITAIRYNNDDWRVDISNRGLICMKTICRGSFNCVMINTNFIEFSVPISVIEYNGGGLFDNIGIEGRFIRSYTYFTDHINPPVLDSAGENDWLMINDFY